MRHIAVTACGKRNIGRLCEGVQYHESYIVARAGIFVADIAQADNEVFHWQSVDYLPAAAAAAAPRAARVS